MTYSSCPLCKREPEFAGLYSCSRGHIFCTECSDRRSGPPEECALCDSDKVKIIGTIKNSSRSLSVSGGSLEPSFRDLLQEQLKDVDMERLGRAVGALADYRNNAQYRPDINEDPKWGYMWPIANLIAKSTTMDISDIVMILWSIYVASANSEAPHVPPPKAA